MMVSPGDSNTVPQAGGGGAKDTQQKAPEKKQQLPKGFPVLSTTQQESNNYYYYNPNATSLSAANNPDKTAKRLAAMTINYKNGRKVEPAMFNYTNYYNHREKLPLHYNPLIQYLDKTEVKFHNDNLYEHSPIGFPTKSQLLKDRVYHVPIINQTKAEKARYRRKLNETQSNVTLSRRKYDFTTYDNYSSHYFLTGARFNRYDTIDSKILNKYGVFINRKNPELVYIKSNENALKGFRDDLNAMQSQARKHQYQRGTFMNASVQVNPASFGRRFATTSAKN